MSELTATDQPRTPTANDTWKGTAKRWWNALDSPVGFLLTLFGAAAAYFALVEWRVNSIVKDPDFRQEVARRVRPGMVFDTEGRVLADMGGLTLLESPPQVKITITTNSLGETRMTTMITIQPRDFLAVEPILESLDYGGVSIAPKRVQGTAWDIFVQSRYSVFGDPEQQPTNLAPARYRLEIVSQR